MVKPCLGALTCKASNPFKEAASVDAGNKKIPEKNRNIETKTNENFVALEG